MKYLKGSDLVQYISERQAKQIRALSQSKNLRPKLAIINANPTHLPSQKYLNLKQKRGEELGVIVDIYQISQQEVKSKIKNLSLDSSVHGIILQLPLADLGQEEELIALIPPKKDVDGLTKGSLVQPSTVGAILWLLAGYNIDLKDKKILIVGQGRLVGAPLSRHLKKEGLQAKSIDKTATKQELLKSTLEADIIITSAGAPGLIKPDMLRDGQVIIDAATAEDKGEIRGDVDDSIYESKLDIKITPKKGGLGPLTISHLFENLLLLIDKNEA